MLNRSIRYPILKTVGSFFAGATFSSVTLFTTLFVTSLPARAESRKLYEYEYLVSRPAIVGGQVVRFPVKATPSRALQELRRCFNCSFPVDGAPRAYPKQGQLIPLKACGIGSFACQDAPVKAYTYDGLKRLQLIAQPGHFDGDKSSVTFEFITGNSGYLVLKVTAFVTKPIIPDLPNKTAANATWSGFAAKLGNNMWANTCAQGAICGI